MNALGTPQRPILIALFGGTGVGKSSFANDASGGNMEIGRTLHSCTKDVSRSPVFQIDGRAVVLIDTPGFDDEEVSDVGTLKQIAAYLSSTYGEGQMLSGIIYLHRITDNRMGGAHARTFNLFRKMCGTQTLRNVVIATNMWSNPPKEHEDRREQQLRTEFFKEALDGGARMVRRATPGRESAHTIVRMLVGQVPLPTGLQTQIVDEGRQLADTDAGQEMEVQLLDRVNRQQREIDEARREIQDAVRRRDEESATQLAQYEREKERDIAELRRQIDSLRQGMEDERKAFRLRLQREQEEFDRQAKAAQQRHGFRSRVKNFLGMGSKHK